MTTTDKPVTRCTRGLYNVLFSGARKARAVVVTVGLGDILTFREHGRRDKWTLNIDTAFRYAVRMKAFADAGEKARERKARGLKPRRKKSRR